MSIKAQITTVKKSGVTTYGMIIELKATLRQRNLAWALPKIVQKYHDEFHASRVNGLTVRWHTIFLYHEPSKGERYKSASAVSTYQITKLLPSWVEALKSANVRGLRAARLTKQFAKALQASITAETAHRIG